ncbi:MAG: tetratricopeptide repeat protein [Verrucomicrobiota bacterium]
MNFIFQSYPAHPWLSEWTFEPRGCGTTFREKNAGYFFHSLKTAGRICPNLEEHEWSLQIPIPQNSRINMLFNGFCGYFEKKKSTHSAEVIVPEPGVLWGRFSNIPAPVLLSDIPPAEIDGFQWLESDEIPALLAVRGETFCLVTKAHIFSDAARLAESYLAKDFETSLSNELEYRSEAINLIEQLKHHDALTVISTECMMRALRPPEGTIPGIWSQSPAADTPHSDANELHTLALAWRHIDTETAENLVRTTLNLQTSSGAIPVAYSPKETFSILEAPKPLMAKTAEKVWLVRKDPQFLNDIIQPLRRHLQWLLHHFDPKHRNLHCWQNSKEPFVPETYESDLATADLAALLLTEIEALNHLRQASPLHADLPAFFEEERDALEHNLQTQFWNEENRTFCNAITRGKILQVEGFLLLIPLLWDKLPARQRDLMVDRIKESERLPGDISLLSWRKSAINNQSFPLLQQQLALETLKTADPHGTLTSGFTKLSLQGLIEWHSLSIEEQGTLQIDPITAAFIINLQGTNHHPRKAKGPISSLFAKILKKAKADWLDAAIIAAVLLGIITIRTIYGQLRKPPPLISLETKMNSAYTRKDAQGTIETGLIIIKYYPDQSAKAKMLTANILLIVENQYKEAALLLTDLRKEYPDSPGPMIALGLAHQLQGNFEDAEKVYAEFTYLFGEIFPEITGTLEKHRLLMQEGFRVPPKWREIYRYQLMHEL